MSRAPPGLQFTIHHLPFTIPTLVSELRINLLGPLHVTLDSEAAAFRTDAERALLAYLSSHQGAPLRRDALAALLSPDRDDSSALTYLRNRLTRLRGVLADDQADPPWLSIDRKQIALRDGDDIAIDLTRFQQLLQQVESHAHRQLAGCPTCLERLQEAVALVRGEFLAGLNFASETWEAWLLGQREHITQRALDAMSRLREAYGEQGDWEALLAVAQRQLLLEPWLEAAHRDAMLASYRLGDRNGALAQFAQCKQLLWDELGVPPEEETAALHRQILDGELPEKTGATPDVNLPAAADPFCGREAEQALLLERLVDPAHRLITLVGTGGVGKSRLAVEVGRQVTAGFPDGVWFVGLDGMQGDAEQIQIAVGEAVGLGQRGQSLSGEQAIALLREKRILIILDNCETVLDGLSFLPAWLRRAPGVAVLATSRQPLNFQAESVVLLDGLPTGDGEPGAAESLFAQRARMARADFALSAEVLPAVRHICELVDGLPLGIALAAAWVRRRSLAQIGDAIGASLDFLSSSLRDVDPRHRSVRAAFETSWQLLSADEQAALAALSVFPASFSAQAAEAVAGASFLHLDALCEKSLLQQQHDAERYSLHALVRQFGAEKLAEGRREAEKAFADYYYQLAHSHRDDYSRLQPEWRNFAAAIRGVHGLAAWQRLLAFVDVLDEARFRQIRFGEMRDGLALAVDAARALGDQPGLARILLRLGEVETELNDYPAAEEHLAEALPLLYRLEDGRGLGQAKYLLGRMRGERSQDEQAAHLLAEAERIFADEGDALGRAKSLNLLAVCHMRLDGEYDAATAHLEASVALLRGMAPSAVYAEALRYLARINSRSGGFDAADDLLAEAGRVCDAVQDRGEYAAVLYERMVLDKRRGAWQAALDAGQEALALFEELGSLRWQGLVKTQLGVLHQTQGQHAAALSLFGEAVPIFDEVGDRIEQAYVYYYLYRLHGEMGQEAESQSAAAQARRLNRTLQIPYLLEQLGT